MKKLQEDPLCPFVVRRIAGLHLPAPVKAEADVTELLLVAGNVVFGSDGRMLPGLYGVLLGRQPEGIKAHGVQHIVAPEPFVAGDDVGGDVAQGMTDV